MVRTEFTSSSADCIFLVSRKFFSCREIRKSARTDLFDTNFSRCAKMRERVSKLWHIVRSSHPDFIWLTDRRKHLDRNEQTFDTNIKKICSSCREFVSKRYPAYCSPFSSLQYITRACALLAVSRGGAKNEVKSFSCEGICEGREEQEDRSKT